MSAARTTNLSQSEKGFAPKEMNRQWLKNDPSHEFRVTEMHGCGIETGLMNQAPAVAWFFIPLLCVKCGCGTAGMRIMVAALTSACTCPRQSPLTLGQTDVLKQLIKAQLLD